MNRGLTKFVILSIAVLALGMQALADDDPPSRAARLAYINGSVSFQPGGVDDWALANANRPLTTADRVWTDENARAEISFGDGVARMSSQTSLTLANVSDKTVQLELNQGTLNVHIRRLEGGEIYEVDTPNVAFMLQKGGDYRFDVDPNGDTTLVTVRRGEGDGTGNGPAVHVREGDQVSFTGGNSLEHRRTGIPDRDGFDDWCRSRDDRQDRAVSARYVSPGMVGYEDLDDYGGWGDDPHYGAVWYPRVAVGWSPYHYGHWAWVEPWGWTWVDDAPWGFAPFHYGRWAYIGNRWGWCPGPRPAVYVRPVYAPALVAFIGGSNFSIGVSFGGGGGVGWVPLGWGEPYYPSYRVSPRYVQNVNVTNTRIVNITNVTNNYTVINNSNNTRITNVRYVNQNVDGAVVAAPRTAFAAGQPISRVAVRVPRDVASRAQLSAAPQVAPSREAVLGGRPPVQNRPPAAALSRPVITRTPLPPPPTRFDAKQPLLQRTGGRPLTAAETSSLPRVERAPARRPGAPNPVVQNTAAPVRPATAAPQPGPGRNMPGAVTPGRSVAPPNGRPVPRPPQTGPRFPEQTGAPTANRPPANNVPRPPADINPPRGNERAPRTIDNRSDENNPFPERQNNPAPRPANPPAVRQNTPPKMDRPQTVQPPSNTNRPTYTPRQEPPRQEPQRQVAPPPRQEPQRQVAPPPRQEPQRQVAPPREVPRAAPAPSREPARGAAPPAQRQEQPQPRPSKQDPNRGQGEGGNRLR